MQAVTQPRRFFKLGVPAGFRSRFVGRVDGLGLIFGARHGAHCAAGASRALNRGVGKRFRGPRHGAGR